MAGVAVTMGLGFTVIVNVMGVPEQTGVLAALLVYLGVTVILPKTGVIPLFTAANTGIVPVLPDPKPIDVLLLDHS